MLPFTTTANPAQTRAITTTDGPLLIIAGPGSGKTFTLVERIVALITQHQVAPESLLVVTFTDKAAQELTTRIANRLNALHIRFNLNEMYLGTFHSICLRWLEEHREYTRLKRNFMLMDQFDQQYFLYQRLRDYDEIAGLEALTGPTQSAWDKSAQLLRWLNTVAEEALDPAALADAPDAAVRVLGQAALLYHRQLAEANALDFATIQYEALTLLRSHPPALADLRAKIRYLMVDEYQDTNSIQEMLLTALAGDEPALCVVGDDDQGLYRFRGATIRNILQFKDRFPAGACSQVQLTVNYRSHPAIIDFYNRWMEAQDWQDGTYTFRYAKRIVPQPERSFPDVPTVLRVGAPSEAGWHQEVLAFLTALRTQGQLTDWNQVAFLFYSVKNKAAVALAQFLEQHDIAVYSPRSNQFFDRDEIRLMIGALIALFPQFPTVRKWNASAELDIWHYYDQACYGAFAQAAAAPEHADLRRWIGYRRSEHAPLQRNTDYAFSGLFYELLKFPLFSRYLDEDRLKGGVQDTRAMRNLAIFSQLLAKFEYLHHINVLTPEFLERNLRYFFNHFLRFLKDGGIDEYQDDAEYAPSGCVSFLTIHQSKGMEFPVVIVGSLGSVPRKSYSDLDAILESGYLARPAFEPLEKVKYYDFRRLYYTAFSRAQNLLVLTAHEVREGRGRTPSKYFLPFYDALSPWRDPSVRLQDVALARVKTMEVKREYSFTSHVTVYENCAEQYRFFKELEFAPVRAGSLLFGTVVHQTIEDIHKAALRGEPHLITPDQVGAWFNTNYTYLTQRDRVYLTPQQKAIALEDVLRYMRRQRDDWSHLRQAEVDVSLVKDEYILTGTVDLIQGEGDTVEIVDFKSEHKPDVNSMDDRPRLERYRRQLEIYAHILEERLGVAVSRMHLYYTREPDGVPLITYNKDSSRIDRTIAAIDTVVQRIEGKDYRIPERPARLCRECDMRAYCDTKNWKFRKDGA